MGLYKELCQILGEENVRVSEPMSRHTTFQVGGPADYFVTPKEERQIQDVAAVLQGAGVPFYIMGNGSNLLVGDKGYRGVMIQICKKMNQIEIQDNMIHAQAGALLSKIAAKALTAGLAGFEFASGIPGTLGGAVMMNAGAYGGEMKQVVTAARVMKISGEMEEVPVGEMGLGYRTSIFSKNGDIVMSADIKLDTGDVEKIRANMEELKKKRVEKQPLEYPSAGSTFKRPEGYFAGKLIQDSGLRGFRVGDAQVSEKHCGFVVNRGQATAAEIMDLIEQVSDRVYTQFGVRLEPEVRQVGEF
ncbi:MAG: UDP-N-acetylmuramate dehydrogenase [Ruminococcus sp.]|nr:UDP-N-acetylmuramate dehydrogenase [Ruminococcus sp.]